MSARPDEGRLVPLDVLRAIAVLLVFCRHGIHPRTTGRLEPLAQSLYRLGWTGVDLFFVLSGFLVGGLLFRELRTRSVLDVRRFVVRRGFKIWPAYYAYLAYVFLLFVWNRGWTAGHALDRLWPNLLHYQNYTSTKWLGLPLSHTWSLAVEEHFYLLLPALLVLLARSPRAIRAVPGIGALVALGCLSLRVMTWARGSAPNVVMQFPTHLRMDSLFGGVLLGYLHHFFPERFALLAAWRRTLFAGAALLISPILLFPETHAFVVTIGFTLLYAGYGCLLVAVFSTPPGSGRLGRFFDGRVGRLLAFVGKHSYSIYLWHIAAGMVFASVVSPVLVGLPPELHWIVALAMSALMACAAGIVLGEIIEWPMLRLRDRWFPARAGALPGA